MTLENMGEKITDFWCFGCFFPNSSWKKYLAVRVEERVRVKERQTHREGKEQERKEGRGDFGPGRVTTNLHRCLHGNLPPLTQTQHQAYWVTTNMTSQGHNHVII